MLQGSTWASKRVSSAYIKAVYVASFSKGAENAQQRHQEEEALQQQQQRRSASPVVTAPVCSWHKAAQLGRPPTFKKTLSIRQPAAEHSRHGSPSPSGAFSNEPEHSRQSSPGPATGLNDPGHSMHSTLGRTAQGMQPLLRRPSTVGGLVGSHNGGPDSPAHARRPATVDPTTLQALRWGERGRGGSAKGHQPGSPVARRVRKVAKAVSNRQADDGAHVGQETPATPTAGSAMSGDCIPAWGPESEDTALQHHHSPEETWLAAIDAADDGQLAQYKTAAHATGPQCGESSGANHNHLTANDLLAFVQGDITTSNDSSPHHSPRPPSRAMGFVPNLQARSALLASNSPGITPRLVISSNELAASRLGSHRLGTQQQDLAQTRERVHGLAERLAFQARQREVENKGGAPIGSTSLLLTQHKKVSRVGTVEDVAVPPDEL